MTMEDGLQTGEMEDETLSKSSLLPQTRIQQFVSSSIFENTVLLLIVVNCLCLALYRPLEPPDSRTNSALDKMDVFFTVAFTVEMLLKWAGMGVRLYFSDGFNVLDCVAVFIGWLSMLPGADDTQGLSSIRTLRVLRPLRTVTTFPGLRVIVQTIMRAVPLCMAVACLALYLASIFAVFGVQSFSGALKHRCLKTESLLASERLGDSSLTMFNEDNFCTSFHTESLWQGRYCQETETCVKVKNPHFGFTSFDNLGIAMLLVFQVVTLEGWTEIMYWTMDAATGWVTIYFILLVFIGSFYVLNLVLAVVTDSHHQVVEADAGADAPPEDLSLPPSEELIEAVSEGTPAENQDTPYRRLRSATRALVSTHQFSLVVTGIIILNTLVLAMQYPNASTSYTRMLEVANLICTVVFEVEMIMKLVGLGWDYFSDGFNIFDMVVNLLSGATIVVQLVTSEASGSGVSGLRAVRVLRVLKMLKSWESLQSFLVVLLRTISELGNFCAVVFLVIFIFGLLGMQLFGGKFNFPEGVPRSNFDSFPWAMITVFQILTGEDWNSVMYSGMRASGSMACVYFVLLLVVGDYLVMNLFIAILLSSFETHRKEVQAKRAKENPTDSQWRSFTFASQASGSGRGLVKLLRGSTFGEGFTGDQTLAEQDDSSGVAPGTGGNSVLDLRAEEQSRRTQEAQEDEESQPPTRKSSKADNRSTDDASRLDQGKPRPLEDFTLKSMWLFDKNHPARLHAYRLATNKQFENGVLCVILISSIVMAVQSPDLDDKPFWSEFFERADQIFVAVFACEMVLKIVAFSLYGEPGCYVRDAWNQFDGTIVVVSSVSQIVSVFVGDAAFLNQFRVLRTLRMLRPLRMIQRMPQLKVVVQALWSSVQALGAVVVVSLLFWLVFGILGMALFMDAFHFCTDPDESLTKDQCIGEWQPFPEHPEIKELREWRTYNQNFDNIFAAMGTLFEMSTTEGWVDIMLHGVDAVSPTRNPVRNHSEYLVLYFLTFMVIAYFFIVNLFVGIIMDNFAEKRDELEGAHLFTTPEQQEWVQTIRESVATRPSKMVLHKQLWRNKLYRVVSSEKFELSIAACIVMNVVVLSTYHEDQSSHWEVFQDSADSVFLLIFALEAAVKIVALGVARYFKSLSNSFDFFIVVFLSVSWFVPSVDLNASMLRMLRITRLLRLVKSFKGFLKLLDTLVVSVPTLCNVGGLLFMLFFIYAIVGVQLFGKVNRDQEFLNRHANFSSFGLAMLTLFRMITGESWNGLMYDCMVEYPRCDDDNNPNNDYGCGNPLAAYMYFYSFMILGSFIMLNLFLAVVLENYTVCVCEKIITKEHLHDFRRIWAAYDPRGTGVIPTHQLHPFLLLLPPPLGLQGAEGNIPPQQLMKMECTILGEGSKFVSFYDVLVSLASHVHRKRAGSLPVEVERQMAALITKTRQERTRQKNISQSEGSRRPLLPSTMLRLPEAPGVQSVKFNITHSELTGAKWVQQHFRQYCAGKDVREQIDDILEASNRITQLSVCMSVRETAQLDLPDTSSVFEHGVELGLGLGRMTRASASPAQLAQFRYDSKDPTSEVSSSQSAGALCDLDVYLAP